MARILCLICRYALPRYARVANVVTLYLHCAQGVPGAPQRTECSAFMREPGADDDVPLLRQLRYPVCAVA